MATQATVYIVDDDESVRRSLRWLLESAHFAVETFASGEEFLDFYDPSQPGCLILDVRMNGMSGLDVQRKLAEKNFTIPVIVKTGHGDVPVCTKAFKAGAFDFIEKPANDKVLIRAIHKALAADAQHRRRNYVEPDRSRRLSRLSPREAEVMELIVKGRNQKQIAVDLNISFQTAAKHRTKVLTKLGVANDVELTRLIMTVQTSESTQG
jgi:two-component system, LuxR family, response regulator FixJ